MKKKVFAAVTAVVMMFSMVTSAFAGNQEATEVDLGDGYSMSVTTTVYHTRSTMVYGQTDANIKYNSTVIGVVTIYGSYDISGSTARAVSGSVKGEGQNGWSYKSGSTSCSGNKVTATVKLATSAVSKTFTIPQSCSPNGTIS